MRFLIYCLLFSLTFLLASPEVSFGQAFELEQDSTTSEPDEYIIGITLANVGEIDRNSG